MPSLQRRRRDEWEAVPGAVMGVPEELLGPSGNVYFGPDGAYATEFNTGVSDERLNDGRETNTPLISEHQIGVSGMMRQRRPHPSRKQFEIAIRDAMRRQPPPPSYDSPEEAEAAEHIHHAEIERLGHPYVETWTARLERRPR